MAGLAVDACSFPFFLINFTESILSHRRTQLASEYDLDIEGARAFLVDATTREGISGAPVVLRSWNQSVN